MKKMMVGLVPLIAIAILASHALSQKVGSTSMQFLKVMPVARATAMGEAYSVLASGAEALFWNPAGVAGVENVEASMTYVKWIFDTRQMALGVAASLGEYGTVGAQLQYVDFGEIPEALWASPYKDDIEFPGLTGNTFRPYAYLIGLSYAYQLTEKFSTGLSVKMAHESLYNGSTVTSVTSMGEMIDAKTWANGILFDFGILYNTGFHSVKLGASVQNFGPSVTYAVEDNSIPLALRVGIAANLIGQDALLMQMEGSRLGVAFDLFQPNDYTQQAHAGVEYEYAGMVALRAGYKFNYDADGFTAGVGVQQTLGGTRFSVDYSYGALDYELGRVHRISIGAGF
jgi:hypothetical protein